MPGRRLQVGAGALVATLALVVPLVLVTGAPTAHRQSAPVAPVAAGAQEPGEPAAPVELGSPQDVVDLMRPPGAAPDPVTLPLGSVPVARVGEPGLELSWALVDTATGDRTGSADAETRRTEAESTIKAWLAADTLRAAAADGRPVSAGERSDISAAVRASDDDAAERLYRRLGRDASIARLEPECGVAVSSSRRGWWSFTQLTAVDAARILGCVRDRAPEWPGGADLLVDLASITPDGRSGVHEMLPGTVAEKNGWTMHGAGHWNVNCVLAWDDRALAVLATYPAGRGVEYGWAACRDVAAEVLAAGP